MRKIFLLKVETMLQVCDFITQSNESGELSQFSLIVVYGVNHWQRKATTHDSLLLIVKGNVGWEEREKSRRKRMKERRKKSIEAAEINVFYISYIH